MKITGDRIVELHCALCGALGTPAWRMKYSDEARWQAFLFELDGIEETEGGPLTSRDMIAVVNLMRKQRKQGTPWSLRYSTIMGKPEAFRDLVFEVRRPKRPRAPEPGLVSRTTGDGRTQYLAESTETPDPKPAWDAGQEALRSMRESIRRR